MPEPKFHIGQQVRIVSGYMGHTFRIYRIIYDYQRKVVLYLEYGGYDADAEFTEDQLEAV